MVMAPVEKEFIALREKVGKEGLLDKQPSYYVLKSVSTFGLLILGIAVFVLIDSTVIRILDAFFFAFVFVQLGLIGHDIAHNQVFHSRRRCRIFGTLYWSLLLGASFKYWNKKHNDHHAHPNELDNDPDMNVPLIFSPAQYARIGSPIRRKIVGFQQWYFFPLISFAYINVIRRSIIFILQEMKRGGRASYIEFLLLSMYFTAYIVFVFSFLEFLPGMLFITIHHLAGGLYMGSIFAPNHKGMPIMGTQRPPFFRRQILTSRNIKQNRFIDFLYGGLNYQIEHHLFPTMPRNNLKKVQKNIKDFCKEYGIAYHETGVVGSFAEILAELKLMKP